MNPTKMNTPRSNCETERIIRFLNADHYHLEDEVLLQHLDECEECRQLLLDKSGGEEALRLAEGFLKPGDYDAETIIRYSQHDDAPTLIDSQQNILKSVRSLLTPSEYPDHLGRLGQYEITGIVGVGGMGIVLKAIDPSLDRIVAVKLMNPKLANNDNARKRFAREAKAAAAILHPNVVSIHSVSSGSTVPYLVMAYVRGTSLQKRLQQEGQLPFLDVLRIGSQIAAGLQAAHDQGLVHRDIKPENILLEEGVERVTITDFGLARAIDDTSVTQFGSIAGTPQYMSPEQAKGESIDHRSDLFSLGSLLYSLCAGRPPFRDVSSYGVMRRIIDDQPVRLNELNPSIPAWFVAIVNKLMAKNRQDRFETAGEVHKLLDGCISHLQHPNSIPLPLLDNTSSLGTSRNTFLSSRGVVTMITLSALVAYLSFLTISMTEKPVEVVQPQPVSTARIVSIDRGIDSNSWSIETTSTMHMTVQLLWISKGTTTVRQQLSLSSQGTNGKVNLSLQKSNMEDESRTPLEPSRLILEADTFGLNVRENSMEPTSTPDKLPKEPLEWFTAVGKGRELSQGDLHLLLVAGYTPDGNDLTLSLSEIKKRSRLGKSFLVVTIRCNTQELTDPKDIEFANTDREKLMGNWKLITKTKSSSNSQLPSIYRFEDGHLTIVQGISATWLDYELLPTVIPKQIDLHEEMVSYSCIYELNGDRLRIRFSEPDSGRPLSFEKSPAGNEPKILEFERVK